MHSRTTLSVSIVALAALYCSSSPADTTGGGASGTTSTSSHKGSTTSDGPSSTHTTGPTTDSSINATTTTTGGGSTASGIGGKGGAGGNGSGAGGSAPQSACSGATHSTAAPGTPPPAVALTVPNGFTLTTIARVPAARQLAALPNGDLLVATNDQATWLVPNADADVEPGAPVVFATPSETPAQGLAFDATTCTIFISSQHNVYAMPYVDAQQSASPGNPIANVRTGNISSHRPSGDTDNHTTTSVSVAKGVLYAGAGSSCNACVEDDPTRAAIQRMGLDGSNPSLRATRFRNSIAMTTNPATGTLWAGGAGQDDLAEGHPFEFFDAVTSHAGVADYGWPACEENHTAYVSGSSCGSTVAPLVELPAYSTIIGAAFYGAPGSSAHAFPSAYRGGLFLAAHGSWHKTSNDTYVSMPQVVFVAMNGDAPATAVDWSDPTKQWTQFVGGFQLSNGTTRIGRPTGVAVGAQGSLFIADDQNGYVYRVRPN